MRFKIHGKPSFCYVTLELSPGEKLITEADAMATMDTKLGYQAKLNGGLFGGLVRKYFGSESLFVTHFSNDTQEPRNLTFTQNAPGDIVSTKLQGNGLYLQPGAFIACTPGVKVSLKWAGFRSWFAREGLFRLYAEGKGLLFWGAFGHIEEKDMDGEYLIDTAHVVGYEPSLQMRLQLSGGLFSSFFSGEGFLTRMQGKGKVYVQSRSLSGLAATLNPKI